jgi:putative endonuclease
MSTMTDHPPSPADCDHNTETRPPWQVYLLRCRDGTLYTGITTDLSRRLHEHNSARGGARYTRARQPVVLVYWEPASSRATATRRERIIRKLAVAEKERLIASLTSMAAP